MYTSGAQYMASVANSQCNMCMTCLVTVPALGSITVALAGLSTAGAATDTIRAALVTNGQGNNATSLTIVKIA